jgi:hypothetical protein
MPLENRVAPTGEIEADPARGSLMGNRGILHDEARRLGRRRWAHKAWISCLLEFRGRWRPVMAPGRYTELFFLDEAVALAAGHRPCGECRREAFRRFAAAFAAGAGLAVARAPAIDRMLHAARIDPVTGRQARTAAFLDALPDGAFVLDADGAPALVHGGRLLPWSHNGYGPPRPRPEGTIVTVLTPPPALAALAAGYRPLLHPSAG